ncbi:MAG: tryptophan 7-halogenase [Alphaproteobacteria bacterium]|nr:tryptophan 7-halogenase [Alphaproteobacteria bacterium]
MTEPIKHITIVGGGTAGWMSAAYLMIHLNRRALNQQVEVTVIESPNVPTVGVGEATVPAMMQWLQYLGIEEADFIKRCNASFKLAVRFVHWDKDPHTGARRSYLNPFDGVGNDIWGFNPAYHFHRFAQRDDRTRFCDFHSPMHELIDNLRGPRTIGSAGYERSVNYAYHLDAGQFAAFLQEIAIACGVNHILDDVVDIDLDEKGYVDALQLKEGGRHPVELVVDCTGFRGMIIQQKLGVKFESYDKHLLNDRAVAVQIPHQDPAKLEPVTTSTALGAGWSWRVPLYSRVGTGYVFSSAFRSDEEAVDEFLTHLGPRAQDAEPRVLGMRVGRSEKSWEKNCVAVGLSGGFIEPLESTAIFMIDMALQWLTNYFPDKSFSPVLQKRFNDRMAELAYEIRDFIVMHYCTNTRLDTDYWRAARNDIQIPDGLREDLELFRHTLPRSEEMERGHLFSYLTYLIVLFGKGYFDDVTFPAEHLVSRRDWKEYQRYLRDLKANLLQTLPNHYELLNHIRSQAQEAEEPVFADAPVAGGDAMAPIITFKNSPAATTANIL